MSQIDIKPVLVRSVNSQMKREAGKLEDVASRVVSVKCALDSSIQSRQNIGMKLSETV